MTGLSAAETNTPPAASMRDTELMSVGNILSGAIEPGLDEFTNCILVDAWSNLRPEIAKRYPCADSDLVSLSPIRVADSAMERKKQFIELFCPDDLLEVTRRYSDTRELISREDALTAERLDEIKLVSPNVYRETVRQKSAHSNKTYTTTSAVRRFTVLNLDQTEDGESAYSVLMWLMREFGMKLRAVTLEVDGYIAWFNPIEDELSQKLQVWLPAFGLVDSVSFDADRDWLVPHAAYYGKTSYSSLLYLAH